MTYRPSKTEIELFTAISSLGSIEESKKFLRDLLTEAELKEFANRWKVAKMLDKKISYKKIEEQTGMSSTTIARIQKWLTSGMGGYKTMLQKLSKSVNHHNTPRRLAV